MKKNQEIPSDLSFKAVTLSNPSADTLQGKVAYKEWPESEVKDRARKRTFKIIGTILLCCIPVALVPLVHFSLIIVVPLTAFASIPLYLKFAAEKATFFYIVALCTQCKKETQMRPYMNSQLQEEMTAQCPECGETQKFKLSET